MILNVLKNAIVTNTDFDCRMPPVSTNVMKLTKMMNLAAAKKTDRLIALRRQALRMRAISLLNKLYQ